MRPTWNDFAAEYGPLDKLGRDAIGHLVSSDFYVTPVAIRGYVKNENCAKFAKIGKSALVFAKSARFLMEK